MARKGQFKKGGGRVGGGKRKRRVTSRALTIVEKPQVKVIRVPQAMVSRRASSSSSSPRRRMSARSAIEREHGAGEFLPGPFRLRSGAVSAALGYADGGKGLTGLKELIDKVPTQGKVPRKLVLGFVANYFADRGDWIDAAAQSLLDIGAYEFGQQGFAMSGEENDY